MLLVLLALITAAPEVPPDPALVQLRLQLNPESPPWTPGYVVERCAEHLATINESDRCRIRYLDMSDLPRQLLPAGISALTFGCNSASRAPVVSVPRAVPNTDNRVFWIDLDWYQWTATCWEKISLEDPYFREPLVPSNSTGLTYMRQYGGNAIIRGSWFLYYTFDTTQFLGKNEQRADSAFYYQLVYGGPGPKTAAEFENAWKVDFTVLKDFPFDQGAVVDENKSGVSYQNRVLWRVRTVLGTYWRTYDVFRSVGDQDFVENPFPREFDAGEHIMIDAKGAQFYLLTDGKGNRVEQADPRLVHDDVSGNKVLLTASSCIHCHDVGILPTSNAIARNIDRGANIYGYGKERAARIRQFYLGDLPRRIQDDQIAYADFIANCNGLTPQENTASFSRVRRWYAAPVNQAQAAREIGVTPDVLADALATGTKGRLGMMALEGTPIPRATWERGGYQEAYLLLLEKLKRDMLQTTKNGVSFLSKGFLPWAESARPLRRSSF